MPRPLPASPLTVFAVEDTTVQLCWGDLPAGPVTAMAKGSPPVEIDHAGGAGSLVVDGLAPATPVDIDVVWADGSTTVSTETLASPPGELLGRVATISDLHLGATRWGFLKTMTEAKAGLDFPHGHPFAAADAAITEAVAWGAEHLVVKGDIAHHRFPEHFALAGDLVDRHPDLPMTLMPGNHDVDERGDMAIPLTIGTRQIPLIRSIDHVDMPGLRIVAVDTTIEGRGDGQIATRQDEIVDLVDQAGRPTLLATHQQLQKYSFVTYWPPGIRAPESSEFLAALRNRDVLVTSGHTHRNRIHDRDGLVQTEVASTRDWPGVWAGYAIHEGGIRQVVRRIAEPSVMAWHEYSRNAVGGLWNFWAPGDLDDRCISHAWA